MLRIVKKSTQKPFICFSTFFFLVCFLGSCRSLFSMHLFFFFNFNFCRLNSVFSRGHVLRFSGYYLVLCGRLAFDHLINLDHFLTWWRRQINKTNMIPKRFFRVQNKLTLLSHKLKRWFLSDISAWTEVRHVLLGHQIISTRKYCLTLFTVFWIIRFQKFNFRILLTWMQ